MHRRFCASGLARSLARHRPVALTSWPQALRAERPHSNMAAGKPLWPPPLASIRQPILMTCARDDRHSALARTTFAADRIRGAGFIGFSGSQPTRVRHGTDAGGPQLRSMKGVNAVQKRPPMTFFALVLALSARFNLIGSVTGLQLLQGLSVGVLMAFCPMTAGPLLQVRPAHGTAGAWGLLMRSVDFRRTTDKRWYLPILLLMPAVCLVVCGVMRGLGWPLPDARLLVGVPAPWPKPDQVAAGGPWGWPSRWAAWGWRSRARCKSSLLSFGSRSPPGPLRSAR